MTHHIKTTVRLARLQLEARLSEGYTSVSFGSGPQVGDESFLSVIAMYHPNGLVSTIERVKTHQGIHTAIHYPVERNYSIGEFEKKMERYQVELSTKYSIDESLKLV